jgi:hypothetical protein
MALLEIWRACWRAAAERSVEHMEWDSVIKLIALELCSGGLYALALWLQEKAAAATGKQKRRAAAAARLGAGVTVTVRGRRCRITVE